MKRLLRWDKKRGIEDIPKDGSKKSICPGKSQIWNCTKEELETSATGKGNRL